MLSNILIFSLIFVSFQALAGQPAQEQEQYINYYQFDENQKRLIPCLEESETPEIRPQPNTFPALSVSMRYEIHDIDLSENVETSINTLMSIVHKQPSCIIVNIQTFMIDNHLDKIIESIQQAIIQHLVDHGFDEDYIMTTIELQQSIEHVPKDKIQITIFFSNNTLDSAFH